jgi:O-antigen ligase
MYVAVVCVLVAGVLAVRKPMPASAAASRSTAAFWVVGGVVACTGLIVMASRGAVLALGIALFLAALVLKKRAVWWSLAIAVAIAASALTVAISLDYSHPIITSMKARVSLSRFGDSNRERTGYVRVAVEQFRQGHSTWLGLGPRNFRSVDVKNLRFDPPLQLNEIQQRHVAHAHNMFLTKLVEEGVIGVAALLAFFALVIARLIGQYRSGAYLDWRWFGALGAVTIPLVAGQANTPFYQEHAMLEMILIAIFLSGDKASRLRGASTAQAPAAPV